MSDILTNSQEHIIFHSNQNTLASENWGATHNHDSTYRHIPGSLSQGNQNVKSPYNL